jgi:hypothetical protein
MTAEERKLLSDILYTLHHVSYTALIELKKEQRSNPNEIKNLEGNKEALGQMIERFRNL